MEIVENSYIPFFYNQMFDFLVLELLMKNVGNL